MGLFQKKKLEDELAVVPRASGVPQASTNASQPPPQAPLVSQRPQSPGAPSVTAAPGNSYGVDRLISLMRDLPNSNVELVVSVLKKTLESVNISVPNLIQDAGRRETELEERMAGHRRAIAALEEEIAAKKKAIEDLEHHYKEVMMVKERLNLSLSLDHHKQVSVSGAPAGTQPNEVITTIVGRAETPAAAKSPTVTDPALPPLPRKG